MIMAARVRVGWIEAAVPEPKRRTPPNTRRNKETASPCEKPVP